MTRCRTSGPRRWRHVTPARAAPCCRYDPLSNQWSSEVAPTSSCRTSVGVAVLDGYLYAVGGQDGVSCLNFVERSVSG